MITLSYDKGPTRGVFSDGQEKKWSSSNLNFKVFLQAFLLDGSEVWELTSDPYVMDNGWLEGMPEIRPEEEDAVAAKEEQNALETDDFGHGGAI